MKTYLPTCLLALGGLLLASTLANAGTFKRIAIDGQFGDWTGVPLAYEDPADSETSADYRRIWIANDDDFLYLRFTLERPDEPFTANDNLFIDTDAESTTGFGIIVGSEMLVQGGSGYEERNGGFNEGGITGLDWQSAPAGVGIEFEARISRRALFASDSSPVFTQDFIALLLEAENANFARVETAPDAEGLFYEFAPPPPPLTGRETLVPITTLWRYNPSSAGPAAGWTEPDFDDTAAGWSSGSALLGYTSNPSAYPLSIDTPLPTSTTALFLRTRFPWNNNPAGIVFVSTNWLSDGAAVYLNGTEIRRVRLPEGTLNASTPATGSHPNPGQPELFALPAGPLVQGENVLAVEVHQDPATTSDLVFGLSLLATDAFPATLPDASQPADRAIVGGQPTSFTVEVIGSEPLTYAWLKDGQPIPDASSAILEINPVLPVDAGSYSVRVSNPPNPGGVTSRGALLTVVSVPVVIVQQPLALNVAEGQPASFSVSVTGSAPLAFQWFKGSDPIPNATNANFEITATTLDDAGDYLVEVSNPATAALRSTPARLSVTRDALPPALVAVSGSPNRIVVAFSEPVDPTTAQTLGNYAVSPALTVSAATLQPDDPATVILTTSAQMLGTAYALTVSNVRDRFGNALASARRSFLSTIQIDGSFDDWAGIDQVVDDPADAENATDYAAAWITSDSDFVYLRVRLHTPSQLEIFLNNLFIDTDGDPATGFAFRGLGSEVLIQGGGGYQQKNGGFNEGGINGLNWAILPEGVAGEFELRFSRRATYATDGTSVFAGEAISLFLESENSSFQTIDVAPDLEPITHILLNPAPVELGPLSISRGTPNPILSWTGAGRLQSAAAIAGAPWQDVAGATSPYTVPSATETRFFRLTQ